MKLAEVILSNERKNQTVKNRELLRIRLKELVYAYPSEVHEVLQKTGVAVSSVLPKSVVLAIVIKHLKTNSELREVIAKMLLELDGYASADGQGWQLVGGALSAVGSVLAGIGRSQGQGQTMSEAQMAELKKQQEAEEKEAKKRKTRNWIIGISIGLVVIIGIILAIKYAKKSKAIVRTPSVTSPEIQPLNFTAT